MPTYANKYLAGNHDIKMSGDNQKTEQHEVKGAAANNTHGLDQYADLFVRTPGRGYSGVTDSPAVIEELARRLKRETGAASVLPVIMPATEADSKAFKKKVVEQRMIGNLGIALGNGKKEGPSEDQSLEPKANASKKNE